MRLLRAARPGAVCEGFITETGGGQGVFGFPRSCTGKFLTCLMMIRIVRIFKTGWD